MRASAAPYGGTMAGIGRFSLVALDCPDPQSLAAFQPGKNIRVFLDPAGHPFCLVRGA